MSKAENTEQVDLGKKKLTDEGVVEYLVHSHRVPTFFPMQAGEDIQNGRISTVLIEVPPQGVRLGDTRKPGFSLGSPSEFTSKEGESLGNSTIYEVTPEEGEKLYRRSRKAIKQIEIPGESLVHKIKRKLF